MTGAEILVNYEDMKKTIDLFSGEAEQIQRLTQSISQQVEVLHRCGFTGKAADAFTTEMESLALPGLNRLREALWFGSESLREIVQIFEKAEEEAAVLFDKNEDIIALLRGLNLTDLLREFPEIPNNLIGSAFLSKWQTIRGSANDLLTHVSELSDVLAYIGELGENANFAGLSNAGAAIGFVSDALFGEDPNFLRRVTSSGGSLGISIGIASTGIGAAVLAANAGIQFVGWARYEAGNRLYKWQFGDDPLILENMLAFQDQRYENVQRISLSPLMNDIGRLLYDSSTGGKDIKEIFKTISKDPSLENFAELSNFFTRLTNPTIGIMKTVGESVFDPGIRQTIGEDFKAIGNDALNVVIGLVNTPLTELKTHLIVGTGRFQNNISNLPLPNTWEKGVTEYINQFQDNVINIPDLYDNWLPQQRAY
ncbi:MAG: hypothetical protein CL609_10710 [Anaerolineaceae bacterium]|nr:hypothetical protein [Anaerolineaceae bacterium]